MKRVVLLIAVVVLGLSWSTNISADTKLDNRVWESNQVLEDFMKMPEKGIPPSLLKQAKAIAVFPNLVKAGFLVAAQHGNGVVVYKDDKGNWTAPAFFRMSGGSVGFQIGGEASDVILVITNERGVRGLLQNKFTIGADASVAAGPVGRNADASTDWKMTASILSYSRSRGLFAGVSLDGVVVNQDLGANESYYGEPLTAEDILISGKGTQTEQSQKLIDTIKSNT